MKLVDMFESFLPVYQDQLEYSDESQNEELIDSYEEDEEKIT
jgi:hypothetical protein